MKSYLPNCQSEEQIIQIIHLNYHWGKVSIKLDLDQCSTLIGFNVPVQSKDFMCWKL